MDLSTQIVTGVLVVVLITLVAFVAICVSNYNPRATSWNLLNAVAAVNIALTLNSIVPQYFVLGRTPESCRFLHHWAGSFYNITIGISRCYFLARSNQVVFAPRPGERMLGRVMMAALIVLTAIVVIEFNYETETMIIPGLDVCIVILSQDYAWLFSLVIPLSAELMINVRFVRYVWKTRRAAGSDHNSRGTQRLLRIMCVMSLLTLMSFLVGVAVVWGLIPISDPSLMPAYFTIDQAINACSMAWPAILIWVMKSCDQCRLRNSSSTPIIPSNGTSQKMAPGPKFVHVKSAESTGTGVAMDVSSALSSPRFMF